jgi:hypothetical protein
LGFITASRSGQCQVANSLEYFTPLNLSTEGFGFSSSRRNFLNTGIFQTKLYLWLGCWRFCNENLITVHSHLLKLMRLVRFLRAFINGNWCALQHATPFEIVGNVLCNFFVANGLCNFYLYIYKNSRLTGLLNIHPSKNAETALRQRRSQRFFERFKPWVTV